MADDVDACFRQHEAMSQGLARMLAVQQVRHERQVTINERLTAALERQGVTHAHIETLVACMRSAGENSRAASRPRQAVSVG